MNVLKSQWAWNREYQNTIFGYSVFLSLLLTAGFYPSTGTTALWMLVIIPCALLFRVVYIAVGNRVAGLLQEHREIRGEVAEGLLVIGKLQSPGIVIQQDGELTLKPIVGESFTTPIDTLEVFREGQLLPGKMVWGKRAFIFLPVEGTRLAFAVDERTGDRWSTLFRTAAKGKRNPMIQQQPGHQKTEEPRPGNGPHQNQQ